MESGPIYHSAMFSLFLWNVLVLMYIFYEISTPIFFLSSKIFLLCFGFLQFEYHRSEYYFKYLLIFCIHTDWRLSQSVWIHFCICCYLFLIWKCFQRFFTSNILFFSFYFLLAFNYVCVSPSILTHGSCIFCLFLFLFALQFRKFPLTYHQAHGFFPLSCLVCWWIHQKHSSFLLQFALISSISF